MLNCQRSSKAGVERCTTDSLLRENGHKIMIYIAGLLCVLAPVTATAPATLKLVNVVYRHGDRSPIKVYPKYDSMDRWPQGFGWLTTVGMQQQYALGQFLRSEYGSLLSPTYKNTEIVVSSSNTNRCLMSAYCNLAGLYPPHGDQVWNSKLLWQPIPVHTLPEDEDHVLAIEEVCPRYTELWDRQLQLPVVKEMERENKALFDYVETSTGLKAVNSTTVWEVADTLFCGIAHNYSLPQWAQSEWEDTTVYGKMSDLSIFSFNLLFNGTELSRLKGGPLLKVFIRNMLKATQQEQHYKMYMYSAHDSTVVALLDALKVFNYLFPSYASAVFVELHQVDAGHCVTVRYRNDSKADPYTLVHPGCQKECCPLEEFMAITKSEIPDDWEAECGNKQAVADNNPVIIESLIIVCCLLTLIALAVCLVAYRFHRRRKDYLSIP